MKEVKIKTEFIKLGQLLKLANLVYSGAEAKEVIQNGEVTLNGEVVVERGKKIRPGDIVEFENNAIKVID
ncbi:ribosome-associated protein [Acetitomaculum ruminis DSM 5522]|uniref:Ribosome-associated protein n=1 Tax=Acetitomaculum ruminis DSM 5522 TaxID=1120918 RepID=A0A1I0ZDT0_9FIRM|nr:RNA-binding S4 domain-containing protein [Acetitomaculum ruminis]SFB23765.1 ribosome-associated protein [Acetitomaculum ruminis DSM 5522]